MRTELIHVPSFTFEQETEDGNIERPVTVAYYNGNIISLEQGEASINLCGNQVKELFREILRHQPEAQKVLKK